MKGVSFTALTFGCFLSACACTATEDQTSHTAEQDWPANLDETVRDEIVKWPDVRPQQRI